MIEALALILFLLTGAIMTIALCKAAGLEVDNSCYDSDK